MKEYTTKNKLTGEEIKAKSLNELSKKINLSYSIVSRFYKMSKKNKASKSENIENYEQIVKTVIPKEPKVPKKKYLLTNKEENIEKYFYKKKDLLNFLKISDYDLKVILNNKKSIMYYDILPL